MARIRSKKTSGNYSIQKSGIYRKEYIRKDGSRVPIEIVVHPFFDDKGSISHYFGFVTDVTERMKAEEKLVLYEEKYRRFSDSLPEIVFETDEEGTPTFLNKKGSEILGYTLEEIKQRKFVELLVPEDRQRAAQNVQRRTQGEKISGHEYRLRKKDGSTFPTMIFSEKIINEDGKVRLRGSVVNISEAKQAEEDLKLLNEKLHVVGGLTRYDVCNKLTVIRADPKFAKYFEDIDSAIKSSQCLFEFSRLYERIGAEKPAKTNVAISFNEDAALFPSLCTIKILNECHGIEVFADSLLTQLFYNLLDNSLKYGERITQVRLHYKRDVNVLNLFYEDDGVGIPQANKPKLFDAGFTTGKGTELGLHLVKKILEVYGWTITEEGDPGKGATFVISVPAVSLNGK